MFGIAGYKIVAGVVGTMVMIMLLMGMALKSSWAEAGRVKSELAEALSSNELLDKQLAEEKAETKRYKIILSRVRRKSDEITAENRTLRDDIAAIARSSDPADCINTAPPLAIRMLLSGHTETGGAGAVRSGAPARTEGRAPDAR